MKTKFGISIAFIIFIIAFSNLMAGWNNSLGISSYYDENPFHYNSSLPLNFNTTNLNLGYASDSSEFGLNYAGNYSIIPQLSYSQLSDNSISLSLNHHYGEYDQNNLILSALYGIRYNSGDFNIYNNNQFGLSASMNNSLSETSIARSGYKGTYKNYTNNSDLSYTEHVLYIGYKTYFETNTSLNTEIDYGYKNLSANLFSLSSGRGSMNNINSTQSLGQVIANVKIGQSLAEKTGLSLMYSQSWNTGTSYKNMMNVNPDMIFEKEIYDDAYSYESKELTLTLTQYIPYNIKLQVYGFYFDKVYEYSSDFSNDETIAKRQDFQKGFGLNLEKTIENSFLVFNNTKLTLNYLYNSNASNSDVFNYNSNAVNFGVKFGF